MAMAIKINAATNDFSILNGKLVLSTNGDSTAERIRVRLKLLLAEWYLDPTLGIPYYTQILGSSINNKELSFFLRNAILKDAEVDQITKFEIFRSKTGTGKVSVNIDVLLLSGEAVTVGDNL